ncbi:hypothetical protein K438DRAFT_1993538 [Mycena galopus ATCC 62051]|nr:hypothetical protein K438DRAFT_1993538 [Mycena galopus ATCC 62051]
MGKTWTTDGEKTFLLSKFPEYVKATSGPKKSSQRAQDAFFNSLRSDFLALFPVPDGEIQQRKGSLVPAKTTRLLRAVEVYQKMYGPHVRAEVERRGTQEKEEKAKFLAGLAAARGVLAGQELKDTEEKDVESQGEARKDEQRWAMSLWRRVVVAMYNAESDEVKATVRERMAVLNMARGLGLQDVDEDEDRTPEQFQHSIKQLVDVVNQVLKTIYEKTGICYGTSPNGNDFQASHEDFDTAVKAPFASYLKRAFPSDVRAARALGPDLAVNAEESATSLDGLLPIDPLVGDLLLPVEASKSPAPAASTVRAALLVSMSPPAPPARREAAAPLEVPPAPWMPSPAFTAAVQSSWDTSDSEFPSALDCDPMSDYGSTASSYSLGSTWPEDPLGETFSFIPASPSRSMDTVLLMGASSSSVVPSHANYNAYDSASGSNFNIADLGPPASSSPSGPAFDERGEDVISPVRPELPAPRPLHRGSSFALDHELGADPGREKRFVLPEGLIFKRSVYFDAFQPTARASGIATADTSRGISSVASASTSHWRPPPSPYRPRLPLANAPAKETTAPKTLAFFKSVVGNLSAGSTPVEVPVVNAVSTTALFSAAANSSAASTAATTTAAPLLTTTAAPTAATTAPLLTTTAAPFSAAATAATTTTTTALFSTTTAPLFSAAVVTSSSGVSTAGTTSGTPPPLFDSRPMANLPVPPGRGGRGGRARGARGGPRGRGGGRGRRGAAGGTSQQSEAPVLQEGGRNEGAVALTGEAAVAESARIHAEEASLRETKAEMLRRSKAMATEQRRLEKLRHNPAGGAPLVLVTRPPSSRMVKAIPNRDGSLRPVVRRRGDMSTSTVATSVDRNVEQAAADAVLLNNMRKRKAPDEGEGAPKKKADSTKKGRKTQKK